MGTEDMTRNELVNLIHRLLFAMDAWALSEEGVPEEAWPAYREACEATGHNIPLTSQPWVDYT
jgi:hypothetical protein